MLVLLTAKDAPLLPLLASKKSSICGVRLPPPDTTQRARPNPSWRRSHSNTLRSATLEGRNQVMEWFLTPKTTAVGCRPVPGMHTSITVGQGPALLQEGASWRRPPPLAPPARSLLVNGAQHGSRCGGR